MSNSALINYKIVLPWCSIHIHKPLVHVFVFSQVTIVLKINVIIYNLERTRCLRSRWGRSFIFIFSYFYYHQPLFIYLFIFRFYYYQHCYDHSYCPYYFHEPFAQMVFLLFSKNSLYKEIIYLHIQLQSPFQYPMQCCKMVRKN